MKKLTGWLSLWAIVVLVSCADDSEDGANQADQLLTQQQQTIESYLANNNINATPDGDIYYQVITENAAGEAPTTGDIIRIYYEITQLDGTAIDERLPSSGEPPVTYVFGTNNLVLPTLDFSINKMRVGEEYEFYLPTAYSYIGYSLGNTIPEDVIIRARILLVDIIAEAELRAEEDERIKDYLANNVVGQADSLSSGVYYVRTQEGDADATEVSNGSRLEVRYTGTLLDGTEFDSNEDAATPFAVTIGSGAVISGFEIGLSQMKLGEKGVIVMPSLTAYEESQLAFPSEIITDLIDQNILPPSSEIPPFSPLRFDVEVVTVN